MKVKGTHYRSIWHDQPWEVKIIDQRWLPHRFEIVTLNSLTAFATAIRDMWLGRSGLVLPLLMELPVPWPMMLPMLHWIKLGGFASNLPHGHQFTLGFNRCRTTLKPLVVSDRAAAYRPIPSPRKM